VALDFVDGRSPLLSFFWPVAMFEDLPSTSKVGARLVFFLHFLICPYGKRAEQAVEKGKKLL
jgi:hypothetical protein